IHAVSINVADGLVLGNGLHAAGQVTLSGAKIGWLLATAGHFHYSPDPVDFAPVLRTALNLTGAQIKGWVLMDRGFESQGAVLLIHAAIGGDLLCTSGRFINPGNLAISAPGAVVGGSVYLQGDLPGFAGATTPFEGYGLLSFEGVQVQEAFVVDGARFIGTTPPWGYGGLDGVDLEVRSGFIWRRVSLENGAHLMLRDASVGFIVDQERGWPPPGKLLI